MAAIIEMREESSPASSDNEDSDSQDDSSSSEEEELEETSWAKMYRSIKLYVVSNEQNYLSVHFIFYIANEATVDCDFLNAIKLYSFGLQQFHKECQPSHPRYTGSKGIDKSTKQIPFDKTMLRYAIQGCSLDKEKLASNKSRVTKILDSILRYLDLLALMDFTLLKSIAYLYFNLLEKQKAFHLSARALQMNPKSLSFQEMFENICCHLVERWHFIMLNDKARNSAYQKAIESVLAKIGRKAIVCDIGCGTGLLSLIACRQPNSQKVFAIEMSTSMCEVASSVFSANLDHVMVKKMLLINKMSTQILVPGHISNNVDILVTETFDAGLFGEGILPTLIHAWTYILNNTGKKRGQVIPKNASLYLQAIECDAILKESRFLGEFEGLSTSKIHIYGTAGLSDSNPYTVHDLSSLPGGYRTLSKPVRFLDVDFNNPQELYRLSRGKTLETQVEITSSGRLDAIVVWFSLYLDDSVVISTHTDNNSCWEQAVFPVHPVKAILQPSSRGPMVDLNLQAGDGLKVRHEVLGAKLCVEVASIFRTGEDSLLCNSHIPRVSTSLSSLSSVVVDSDLMSLFWSSCQFLKDQKIWRKFSVYCLNSREVSILNNASLHTALYKRLQELFALFKKDNSEVDFIHLNDALSPLCLQALKHGFHQATVLVQDRNQRLLLQKILALNDIAIGKLKLVEDVSDVKSLMPEEKEKTSEDSPGPGAERSVVFIYDLVDPHGRVIDGLKFQQKAIRSHLSRYKTVGVAPYSVDVYGILIDSERLQCLSRVQSDENTLGFKIGCFINKYATRNHQDFSLRALPHTKLSEPFKMFTINTCRLFNLPETMSTAAELADTTKRPDECLMTKPDVDATGSEQESELGASSSQLGHKRKFSEHTPVNEDISTGLNNCSSKNTSQCVEKQNPKQSSSSSVKDGTGGSKEGSQEPKLRRLSSDDDDDDGYDASPDYDDYMELAELTKSVHLKVPVIQPGNVTALVYWFDLHISPTCSISTLDPAHHWNQSAVMSLPSQNQNVEPGHVLNLSCEMSGPALSFFIE